MVLVIEVKNCYTYFLYDSSKSKMKRNNKGLKGLNKSKKPTGDDKSTSKCKTPISAEKKITFLRKPPFESVDTQQCKSEEPEANGSLTGRIGTFNVEEALSQMKIAEEKSKRNETNASSSYCAVPEVYRPIRRRVPCDEHMLSFKPKLSSDIPSLKDESLKFLTTTYNRKPRSMKDKFLSKGANLFKVKSSYDLVKADDYWASKTGEHFTATDSSKSKKVSEVGCYWRQGGMKPEAKQATHPLAKNSNSWSCWDQKATKYDKFDQNSSLGSYTQKLAATSENFFEQKATNLECNKALTPRNTSAKPSDNGWSPTGLSHHTSGQTGGQCLQQQTGSKSGNYWSQIIAKYSPETEDSKFKLNPFHDCCDQKTLNKIPEQAVPIAPVDEWVSKGAHADQLASRSVQTDQWASWSVPTDKKASRSVQTDQWASWSVPTDKKASRSVQTDQWASWSVPTDQRASRDVQIDQRVSRDAQTDQRVSRDAQTDQRVSRSAQTDRWVSQGAQADQWTSSEAQTDIWASRGAQNDRWVSNCNSPNSFGQLGVQSTPQCSLGNQSSAHLKNFNSSSQWVQNHVNFIPTWAAEQYYYHKIWAAQQQIFQTGVQFVPGEQWTPQLDLSGQTGILSPNQQFNVAQNCQKTFIPGEPWGVQKMTPMKDRVILEARNQLPGMIPVHDTWWYVYSQQSIAQYSMATSPETPQPATHMKEAFPALVQTDVPSSTKQAWCKSLDKRHKGFNLAEEHFPELTNTQRSKHEAASSQHTSLADLMKQRNMTEDVSHSQYGLSALVALATNSQLQSLYKDLDVMQLGINFKNWDASIRPMWPTLPNSFAFQDELHQDSTPDTPYFEYYFDKKTLPPLSLKTVGDDVLFFLFYCFPKDERQLEAAKVLFQREWRLHREVGQWFKRKLPPTEQTAQYEKGVYIVFDQNTWSTKVKYFLFEYSKMENECPAL